MLTVLPLSFLLASALPPSPQDVSVRVQTAVLLPQAEAFVQALRRLGVEGAGMGVAGDGVAVAFGLGYGLGAEGYRVTVEGSNVTVEAGGTAGAAYAASDLLRRVRIEGGDARFADGAWEESPDFGHRSFMVDMGRNPHSPATLRHVVDMMWFYRGNYLQLHLTDDQLISWPSAAFPELQSERAGWTVEDFRELEAYSQARGVTVVPEIEVPGHSSLLRSRRPDVFGKDTLELATSPVAQRGVETLIREMLDVFRATPYVHIGADEVHGVPQSEQRAFINRLNAFVKSLGRTTLVWEGPGLGEGDSKVAEDVVHVAWEGSYFPMPKIVEAGYRVVNASWDPFYVVDHYPRNNFTGVPTDQIYAVDLRRLRNVHPGLPSFREPQWLADTSSVLGFCMPFWEGREQNLLAMCVQRFGAAATRAWDYGSELPFEDYAAREAQLLPRLEVISGFELPEMPMADPGAAAASGNLAFGARVTPSAAMHQPDFGPSRLTNGITDQFDLFLGYPTKPEPLVIDIELREPAQVGRVRVHEIAVGNSWESYRLFVSADWETFEQVGRTQSGDRGENRFVDHRFDPRTVRAIRIETDGCENFTFPSFSRLTEVEAYGN
ncbi:MAG: family 20 glycosylhydrolase [Planctomycetota bacterium]|nr:family 20 glycosylhydrolase [Planctomycetota bacterium]